MGPINCAPNPCTDSKGMRAQLNYESIDWLLLILSCQSFLEEIALSDHYQKAHHFVVKHVCRSITEKFAAVCLGIT